MSQKFIKLQAVKQLTALGRTSIYNKVKAGQFPKPFSLGLRSIAWLSSDIDTWIQSRVDARAGGSK